MAVYVDPLMARGWHVGSRLVPNCHMFTDDLELSELHAMARLIGLQALWFQDAWRAPHYDLTPTRRRAALEAGAIAVPFRTAAEIWRARRVLLRAGPAFPDTTSGRTLLHEDLACRPGGGPNAVLPLTERRGMRA